MTVSRRAQRGAWVPTIGSLIVAVLLMIGNAGCGRITDPEGVPTVTVLSETVRVERSADAVGFAIEVLIRNDGPRTIYRIPCGLVIERLQGGRWSSAYSEACLEGADGSRTNPAPVPIAPGQQRLEIVELRAVPGAEPPLLQEPALPAELRLVLPLAYTAGDLGTPGVVVGRQARTSNPFALVP